MQVGGKDSMAGLLPHHSLRQGRVGPPPDPDAAHGAYAEDVFLRGRGVVGRYHARLHQHHAGGGLSRVKGLMVWLWSRG